MAYTLPELGYAYDALEPHFDAMTMEIHHSKHHQTYVNNANAIVETLPEAYQSLSAEALIARIAELPADKQTPVRNNVGGHANHTLFWQILKTGTTLSGSLKAAIERDFGSVEAFFNSLVSEGISQIIVEERRKLGNTTRSFSTPIPYVRQLPL